MCKSNKFKRIIVYCLLFIAILILLFSDYECSVPWVLENFEATNNNPNLIMHIEQAEKSSHYLQN